MAEQPLQRLRQHPVGRHREAQVVADRQVLEQRLLLRRVADAERHEPGGRQAGEPLAADA